MEDAEIDPYKILELDSTVEDVTDSDVLKAYRKLSLKYHPDRNKSENATQMFQRLTAARDMLLDTEARAAFVQVRRAKRARQEQEEQMDEQARARSKQRRAMAEELERRERTAAKSLSDLQRAQANLAAQMRRMREMAIAKKRAELRTQAATAATAAAAAAAEAAAAGQPARDGDADAPSSFPGVRVGPPRPPGLFPSSFPGAGAGNGVAGASAPAADGTKGAEARPGEADSGKQLGAGGSLGRDAEGVAVPSDSEYREQSKVGEGTAQSAAAKQLERDALRARLLAEAEAEDALNQSD